MKKMNCILLAILMLLSLAACGGQGGSESAAWSGQFAVGFGRADVTPKASVTMSGYAEAGEATRTSQGVLNNLYLSCVAITDEAGDTLLLYTLDCIRINHIPANQIRESVSKATGVPVGNIMISATHSHSTPDVDQPMVEEAAVQAATDAMADRAAATMTYAATELEQMSFVRHYTTENGAVVGSNFTVEGAGNKIGHTTEADKELRVLRFEREGKKPIIMANWLGHATMVSTGSSDFGKAHRYMVSSDYVGFCQDYVEKNMDCHFALYMGASGNISTSSSIAGESLTDSPIEYGEMLGQHILDAVQATTELKTGTIKTKETQFEGVNLEITVNAFGFGDVGIITAPFEMFDTTSMGVREQSPYEATFVLTQTNGANGYMPTDICFDYIDCYEVRHTNFYRGSAEKIIDVYVQLLKDIHG